MFNVQMAHSRARLFSGKWKFWIILSLCCLPAFQAGAQNSSSAGGSLRLFDDLFPGIRGERRDQVFSGEGLIIAHEKNQPLSILPASGSGISLPGDIAGTNPSHLAESLIVVPYSGRVLGKLDAYNALGNIRGLQGRLYNSNRRGWVPLFEEATRLAGGTATGSDRRNTVPDPPPASILPSSDRIFIRLRDANFGNSFYEANFTVGSRGITYRLTNTRNLSYLFVTAMREGRFNAIIYIEALEEGMLVYSAAGADVSDFAANRINVPSSISRRLAVFVDWISDGLKAIY